VELFTQVLVFLRSTGLARLGTVAIDSTRVKAQASPDRVQPRRRLEDCAEGERWQRELDDDRIREPGTRVGQEQIERVREQLKQLRQGGRARYRAPIRKRVFCGSTAGASCWATPRK